MEGDFVFCLLGHMCVSVITKSFCDVTIIGDHSEREEKQKTT